MPTTVKRIEDLIEVMRRLRDPRGGCPWDVEQTFATIAPYTIEEAYEVADSIERGDLGELRGELGDLLFQVVFHARMAEEADLFDFDDVVTGIVEKMVRRHPHVFADASVGSSAEQTTAWEAHKAAEREAAGEAPSSLLNGVTRGLPALRRAAKLQRRAAGVGFDWTSAERVLDKLSEEVAELREAMSEGGGDAEAELGDVLFTCVNLARHLGVDPDHALRRTNGSFERRFRRMEAFAAQEGASLDDLDAEALERLWERAKEREGASEGNA